MTNKFLIFYDPNVAVACRAAGWAVFKQTYNGQECFAVEENDDLLQILPILKQDFGVEFFARSNCLHF